MKRTSSPFVILSFILVFLIGSCQSSQPNGKCISPSVTWEFPVMVTAGSSELPPQQEKSLPSGGWTTEAQLPFKDHVINIVTHASDEVWVQTEEKLYRYRISTHEWDDFSFIKYLGISPKNLYESNDGTLWGFGKGVNENLDVNNKTPLLIRYKDEIGQFEFVRDRSHAGATACPGGIAAGIQRAFKR